MSARQPLASAMRRASISRPSETSIIARDQRREPLARLQPGARVAVALDQSGIGAPLQQYDKARTRIADRARHPQMVAGRGAAAVGRYPRRPADRGQAQHPGGRGDGVAAEQGDAERPEHRAEPFGEGLVPCGVAEREAEQDPHRPRALRGEIGEVHRDQLPGDVFGWIVGQIMDALDEHVVGQHDRAVARLQHRRIVHQPARRRIGGERAQRVDEGGFAAYVRTSFAMPSSRPLTKPDSRAS